MQAPLSTALDKPRDALVHIGQEEGVGQVGEPGPRKTWACRGSSPPGQRGWRFAFARHARAFRYLADDPHRPLPRPGPHGRHLPDRPYPWAAPRMADIPGGSDASSQESRLRDDLRHGKGIHERGTSHLHRAGARHEERQGVLGVRYPADPDDGYGGPPVNTVHRAQRDRFQEARKDRPSERPSFTSTTAAGVSCL